MSRLAAVFPPSGLALIALLAVTPAFTQNATPSTPATPELRVFDTSLIDKSVDPCENFYRYSCNGWFKRNPLPPDQTSYGRFTELYELNRLHLKQILEDASKPAPNRTPNEQKIGDEYASCMDTANVNQLGLTAVKPELDRIAALRRPDELPVLLAHLHTIGVNAFFDFGADQDYADASQVISSYGGGGLGLPERDYYFRTDAKSAEQRKQYVDHVHKIFMLAGESETQAARDADTVMAIETRLAKASPTITEMRDPQNLNHPTDVAAMSKLLTHFSLNDYVEAAHAPGRGKGNDSEPKDFCEFNALRARTPLPVARPTTRSRSILPSSMRWWPTRRSSRSAPICAGICSTPTPEPACPRPSRPSRGTSTRTSSTVRKSSRSAGSAAPAAWIARWARRSARSMSPNTSRRLRSNRP